MAVVKQTGNFNNVGAAAPSGNFGPFTTPTIVKLLSAKATMTLTQPIDTIATTTAVTAAGIAGIQVVFAGGGPFALPANANLANFLDFVTDANTDTSAVWAPSTDTAAHTTKVTRQFRYSGQKFFGAALDFYVTWGSTFAPTNQTYSGYFELVYTT